MRRRSMPREGVWSCLPCAVSAVRTVRACVGVPPGCGHVIEQLTAGGGGQEECGRARDSRWPWTAASRTNSPSGGGGGARARKGQSALRVSRQCVPRLRASPCVNCRRTAPGCWALCGCRADIAPKGRAALWGNASARCEGTCSGHVAELSPDHGRREPLVFLAPTSVAADSRGIGPVPVEAGDAVAACDGIPVPCSPSLSFQNNRSAMRLQGVGGG